MAAYSDLHAYYGDIHNHCAISYGLGSLEDALANARERLDFVSITGHAHWPDMPEPNARVQHIIDFHEEGFAKLKKGWQAMMETLRETDEEGSFIIYPAFEVHFCATGDRNVLYKDLQGDILYPQDLADLNKQLRVLREQGHDSLAQPHHVGYKTGTRGIDWKSFDPEFAPVAEMLSMHGCSESNENPLPFLHVMGPSDWESTIQYGLAQGNIFGFTGGTDHHSGHPGSYGHGLTGVWANDLSRDGIWDAMYQRRTWAMTGDRIDLKFAIDGQAMGSVIKPGAKKQIDIEVAAGAAIDYVDIIKNNRLLKRFSQCDFAAPETKSDNQSIRTKLHLELGWGPRKKTQHWEVEFGIREGKILQVEPRFRGQQVVSPLEADGENKSCHSAHVNHRSDTAVQFTAVSEGNANNFSPSMQGMCLEIEATPESIVYAVINGQTWQWPLATLIEGARSDLTNGIESPALRIHRAALPEELNWHCQFEDQSHDGDFYYTRVRQKNEQWAWSSPIFAKN
ncbi:MAG: DUF3604 domain-containing protein [Verrucomicrobiota bacterium]